MLAEIIDEPAWKTIAGNIYDLLYPRKLPPLVLTSTPIPVKDPMKEDRGKASSIISIGLHVIIIVTIFWAFLAVEQVVTKKSQLLTDIDVPQFMPIAKGPQMGGGGGGGSHEFSRHPKASYPVRGTADGSAIVIKTINPELAMDPAIMMPKDLQLPTNDLPNLGDPRAVW